MVFTGLLSIIKYYKLASKCPKIGQVNVRKADTLRHKLFSYMKRKLYETQTIDLETGEMLTYTSVSVSKFNETFLMARNTEELDWLYELNGNEIKTIIYFTDLENLPRGENKTGKVLMNVCKFTQIERKRLAAILKCTDRHLRRLLSTLEKKGWLIRLSLSEYLVNPCGFYKGSSKELFGKIKEFNRLIVARDTAQRPAARRRNKCSETGDSIDNMDEDMVCSTSRDVAVLIDEV
jgi:hypothetical protein